MRNHNKRSAQAQRIALRKTVTFKKRWGGRYTHYDVYLRVMANRRLRQQKEALRKACDSCNRVCPLRIPHDISPCNYYSRSHILELKIYFEMLELVEIRAGNNSDIYADGNLFPVANFHIRAELKADGR